MDLREIGAALLCWGYVIAGAVLIVSAVAVAQSLP